MPRNRRMADMLMRGRRPYPMMFGMGDMARRGGRRGDRAMDMADYEGDMARGRGGDRAGSDYGDMARGGRGGGRGRDYGDMARGGDRARGDMAGGSDYARGDRAGRDYNADYARSGGYDSGSRYPFAVSGEFGRYDGHHYDPYMMYEPMDFEYDMARGGRGRGGDRARGDRAGRDYGMYDFGGGMLEDEDLEYWTEKLKKEVEEKDKQFFSKEHLKKKAEEMGIKFDKFSFEEFMVTALMMYTDYYKTLGTANMDLYLRLAKDWLCDEDVSVKYGEKLATYYDCIVEA